ncbi:MAG: hypothetical protein Q4D96_09200 [Propionibacteriaceae bacterium]|nr:hypothetical protein [Propionibacteriaceae bacterium]
MNTGSGINRWWRRSWYRIGRGRLLRRLVRALRWQHPTVRGTWTSGRQLPALLPVLTCTELENHGTPLGLNIWTNQVVCETAWDLYCDGFLTATNQCIIGDLGVAKSSYVKTMLTRSIATGGRAAVFDRKNQRQSGGNRGEYTKLSDAVGGTTLRFHQDRRLGTVINVLDPRISVRSESANESGIIGQDRLLRRVAETALERDLSENEKYALNTAHHTALNTAATEDRVATLHDVIHALQHPVGTGLTGTSLTDLQEWGLPVVLGLLRYTTGDLTGLIDGETSGPDDTEVSFDAPLLVFDTSALEFGSEALALMMAITATFLLAVWVNTPGEKSIVVEETYSAEGVGTVPKMFRDITKRARGVGASVISVFHHISDVAPGSPLRALFDEAELICIFRQAKVDHAQAVIDVTGLDPSSRHLIQTLPRGTHLRVRGARLPAIVVEMTRTELEEHITFTDDAFEEDT